MRATGVILSAVLALASAATATASWPPMPEQARRALERNWCDPGAYARARRLPGLELDGRRNLYHAAKLVRAHPRGCRVAERAARRLREQLPARPPWTRSGAHGDPCPLRALPPGPGARAAAERAAAAAEGRRARPVVLRADRSSRARQMRYACGARALRRSVIVTLSLTAHLPSASLSDRVVAVARFSHYGWRVWTVLH